MVLKFALNVADAGSIGQMHHYWMDEVEKRTGGRVKVQPYWAESLAKGADILEATRSGLTDVGEIVTGYTPGKVPLSEFLDTSWGIPSQRVSGYTNWQLVTESPIKDEWASIKLKPLYIKGLPNYGFNSVKRVTNFDEWKGLRIRAFGTLWPNLLKKLGLVPVSVAYGETYDALARKIVDGGITNWDGVYRAKWYEVSKYLIQCDLGSSYGGFVAINPDTWSKISAADQKAIEGLTLDTINFACDATLRDEATNVKEMQQKTGFEIVTLAPDVLAKIKVLQKEWISDITTEYAAKGIKAGALFDRMFALADKYSKEITKP